ncbi:MAG TPA: hypothetical protein VI894_03495 [Candidatus Nanoarchaeia archaeon]|nr:hypothetical protein [Candidatus Nanoarchaeia archaeon]
MANVKATKVKKKKWYTIVAGPSLNDSYLGEVTTAEPLTLVGRPISVNMMEIMRDPKKQHLNMRFKITSVQGEKAVAEPISIEESNSYIKRLVRRKRDKIDSSFVCTTADNKIVRVKYFILTFSNTKNSIRTRLSNSAKDIIIRAVRKTNFEVLMDDIVSYKFQYYLKDQLKKIYPLKTCDIRYFGIEINPKAKVLTSAMVVQADYTKEAVQKEESEEESEIKIPKEEVAESASV